MSHKSLKSILSKKNNKDTDTSKRRVTLNDSTDENINLQENMEYPDSAEEELDSPNNENNYRKTPSRGRDGSSPNKRILNLH